VSGEIGLTMAKGSELTFINYTGLEEVAQFAKIPTNMIGKAILAGNFEEACALIMKKRQNEDFFVKSMRKICQEKNHLEALLNLPSNILTLYTHAYQSFIWNRVASKRWGMGLDVIEGDLVFTEGSQQEIVELEMVRPLTAEDVAGKCFTIYDIVLPLLGHAVKYPPNEIGEFYSELLAEDNLTLEKLKSEHE
jgi:tRNA pseudouridine13 synthase